MGFFDVLSLAYRTVRGNKLRTGITIAIIAFGIMALIGIITAIAAMNLHFGGNDNNDIKLSRKGKRREKKSNLGKVITKDEAELFVRSYQYPAIKSIYVSGGRNSIASYEQRKTGPNIMLAGGDENYLLLNGFTLAAGRNMNRMEVESGSNVCLLGYDVAKRLFREGIERAVNAVVRVNNIPFRVLGVLSTRGSTFGFSRDNIIIASYNNVERNFPAGRSYVVAVMTGDLRQVNEAMGEAEGSFRAIRKLLVTEENNFALDKSDSVAEKAMKTLGYFTLSIIVIGFITLIGAAIALMNIMLVSVSERTREVGLAKAIGGKSRYIRIQFLMESIIISLFGALFGIIFGILLGNVAALLFSTGFVVPWNWVMYGIVICSIVGLVAGLYPALKAGRLNPIDALRYE